MQLSQARFSPHSITPITFTWVLISPAPAHPYCPLPQHHLSTHHAASGFIATMKNCAHHIVSVYTIFVVTCLSLCLVVSSVCISLLVWSILVPSLVVIWSLHLILCSWLSIIFYLVKPYPSCNSFHVFV